MATTAFVGLPKRMLTATIDGREVQAAEGTTILDACRRLGVDTPTLCYLETLTPVNVCRVCVVEVEGSRVLVPACSRKLEAGLKAQTDSDPGRTHPPVVPGVLRSPGGRSLTGAYVQRVMGRHL